MTTCKDCLHFEPCYEYGNVLDPTHGVVICDSFKKRDNYIEVVRCKDCKYCEDHLMGGLFCDHPDNRNPLGCRPNDYCNDGERNESEVQE